MIGSPTSFPVSPLYPASQQNRYPQPPLLDTMPDLPSPMDLYKPDAYKPMAISGALSPPPLASPIQPSLLSPSPSLWQPAPSLSLNRPTVPLPSRRTPFAPLNNLPVATNPSALGSSLNASVDSPLGRSSLGSTGINTASRLPSPSPFSQPFRPSLGMPGVAVSRPGFNPGLGKLTANAAGSLAEDLTPAEETGEKIKKIVVALLEDNPALQEKVQQQVEQIDVDAIEENIGPKLESFRSSVQPGISKVPMPIVRRVINAMCGDDPAAKQLATEFVAWLRKPPEAALAENEAPARPGGRANGGHRVADDPFAEDSMDGAGFEEDPFESEAPSLKEAPPKKTFIGNLKSKVWPFNKEENKENIEPEHLAPRKRKAREADFDSLLDEPPRPARKRPRPTISSEDDLYY